MSTLHRMKIVREKKVGPLEVALSCIDAVVLAIVTLTASSKIGCLTCNDTWL